MTKATGNETVTLTGGVVMPLLGLGTWQLTGSRGYQAVRDALEVGYRLVDTATAYGNEAEVGRALADSGVRRDDVFLTTKLPPERAGRERETLDGSLRALGVDTIDLWLVHWPPNGQARPDTWRRLLAARDEGLVRAVGVSNYSTAQIDELIAETGEAPAVNQIKWGPRLYDAKRLAESRERGVVLEGYSPFKTTDLDHPVLTAVAEAHGVTTAQVVLRWHLDHGVVVIPKSGRAERIRSNADVFGFALSDAERDRVDGLAGRG
jgi:2,5-diketo-D-gluconate reductase A